MHEFRKYLDTTTRQSSIEKVVLLCSHTQQQPFSPLSFYEVNIFLKKTRNAFFPPFQFCIYVHSIPLVIKEFLLPIKIIAGRKMEVKEWREREEGKIYLKWNLREKSICMFKVEKVQEVLCNFRGKLITMHPMLCVI